MAKIKSQQNLVAGLFCLVSTAIFSVTVQQNFMLGGSLFVISAFCVVALHYMYKVQSFIEDTINVCKRIIRGDFEARVINLSETGQLKDFSDTINTVFDVNDAFVREAMLSSEAASNKQFYRKIRLEGMQGMYNVASARINEAANIMEEKSEFEIKNKNAMDAMLVEVNKIVDYALQGKLEQRINTDKIDDSFSDLLTSFNTLMDTISNPMSEVVKALSHLEKGNLDYSFEGEYKGDFAEVQKAYNSSIHTLKSVLTSIQQSAIEVTHASDKISTGTQHLSERSTQQASSIEETAASMQQIAAVVKQNSDAAKNANDETISVHEVVSKGGVVAEDAINAMNNIKNSSKKISDIISVMDEIAFQTNLLALNAAVEAARAGEAGKGFAVVASEVRSLASRSSEASKEIKTLIQTSSENVENGEVLVNEAGTNLKNIASMINNISQLVEKVAIASQEQSSSVEEINASLIQMEEITQKNAALVENNVNSTETLANQASQLDKVISFFTLDDKQRVKTSLETESIESKPKAANENKLFESPKMQKALAEQKIAVGQDAIYDTTWKEM